MQKCEIPWNFMKFSKFHEICGFCGNHTSKPSIFPREYRCFCDLLISTKILIFTWKLEISKKIIFVRFYDFYIKSCFLLKMGPRGPKTPKMYIKCIGLTRVGASGPRGWQKLEKLWIFSKCFCVCDGKWENSKKSWNSVEIHHLARSWNLAQTNGLTVWF